jgi:hypothetical protein
MPLIDLQTNLKSLVYGSDRPGGGSSGQPFISTNINTLQQSVTNRNTVTSLLGTLNLPSTVNRSSAFIDGSVRGALGAAVNDALSTDNYIRGGFTVAARSSATDVLRIGSFMASLPRGLLFIQKQKDLQFSNPRLEIKRDVPPVSILLASSQFSFPPTSIQANRQIFEPTRFYSPVNTLAQVGSNAFGEGNYDRHGRLPSLNDSDRYSYERAVRWNAGLEEASDPTKRASEYNRLLGLKQKFNLGKIVTKTAQINEEQAGKKEKNKFEKQAAASKENVFSKIKNLERNFNRSGLGQVTGILSSTFNFKSPSQIVSGFLNKRGGASISNRTISNASSPTLGTTANVIIDRYPGGPDSLYGIGETIIFRATNTARGDAYKEAIEKSATAGKGTLGEKIESVTYYDPTTSGSIIANDLGTTGFTGLNSPISDYPGIETDIRNIGAAIGQSPLGPIRTYADIANRIQQTSAITTGSANTLYGIFNSDINSDGVNNGNYSSTNIGEIEYRNSYGNVVTLKYPDWQKVSREQRVGSGRQDSINLTPLFSSDIGKNYTKIDIGGTTYNVNDLCKFKIEAIDGGDPTKSVHMVFRAYLTDLSDNITSEWSDIKYVGRGDKFYIYNGFNRTISVSFKVAALSAEEMKPMYQKLNHLISNMMPDYTDEGLMRGPLSRLTVGNWVDSQPGIITSLNYKIPQDSPWEIAINEPTAGGSKEMILPHIVEVTLSFTPIGAQTQKENKIPRRAKDTQHTSYIAQNYNGAEKGEPNYIGGGILVGDKPKENPQNQANQNKSLPQQQSTGSSVSQTSTINVSQKYGNITSRENFATNALLFGGVLPVSNRPR